MGPALNIDGRTPLPVSMDNIATLIAGAYVVSILYMLILPKFVIIAGRICTIAAMLTLAGLFFPLGEDTLRLLIYAHIFICCTMIGFETFIMVNYFSENAAIKHLTVAYGVCLLMISVVQNDFIPITFPVFRIVTVFALICLAVFYFRMPSDKDCFPEYVRKSDNFTAPKKLLFGTFVLIFISALMAVSGPSIAAEVPHGVFVMYFTDAIGGILMYIFYKKLNTHPFRSISLAIALGGIGFILMYASAYIPAFSYVSCAFIGLGMLPCQMIPLYCVMIMKTYPSKYLTALSIGLSLIAVIVQSTMIEAFRNIPSMLNLAYGIIMVILVIIYLQIEPYFMYSFKKNFANSVTADENSDIKNADNSAEVPEISEKAPPTDGDDLLSTLTKREAEVLEFISYGYSNSEIAKALVISEHTVNDYTKKIYRKLGVHSRYAAAQYITRSSK